MKIERPNWLNDIIPSDYDPVDNKLKITDPIKCFNSLLLHLNHWFDNSVEPVNKMLSKRIRVYTTKGNHSIDLNAYWSPYTMGYDTHEALLINMQLIKKETAEDVLRDLLKIEPRTHSEYSRLVERARVILEGAD